ncbi:MAG TPA: hypothetical protein VLD37_04075 [Candidatus Bilamarchaeum sp.]|nr:hypothetical protein [Candidatus Bilamarchaeum sp.]
MGEITRTKKLFTTRVVGEDSIGGLQCTIDARKTPFSSRYEVLLDTPGKSDEPRLVASGSFIEALRALKRSPETGECVGLLKAVSLSLGDEDAELSRRFRDDELSVLVLLVGGEMGAGRMSEILKMPESTLELTLISLKGDGIVSRKAGGNRPYCLSETGRRICELMKDDAKVMEIVRRVTSGIG